MSHSEVRDTEGSVRRLSMKSDKSMECPLTLKEREPSSLFRQKRRSDFSEQSYVSMESAWSTDIPENFTEGAFSTERSGQPEAIKTSYGKHLESVFQELEHKIIAVVKTELNRFKKLLRPDYSECCEREAEEKEDQSCARQAALRITLHILKNMNQSDLANTLLTKLAPVAYKKIKSKLGKKKARLSNCNLTERSCKILASALSSSTSNLRELYLSNNELQDSGVKLLSAGLLNPHCKLEALSLNGCNLTGRSCGVLASVLSSNTSRLKELDLSYNELNPGMKQLSAGLENPHCKLRRLSLYNCNMDEEDCAALISALKLNPSHLSELNLGLNKPGDTGVEQLSALLEDQNCKLEKLKLFNCSISQEGCAALVSALHSNPSHLTELDLTWNTVGDSEVKLLSALKGNPHYKLEKVLLHVPEEMRTLDRKSTEQGKPVQIKVEHVSDCDDGDNAGEVYRGII
ncbi:hypothetical protein AOLI_G00154150 [Acnodon oligacanthus]